MGTNELRSAHQEEASEGPMSGKITLGDWNETEVLRWEQACCV